MRKDERVDNIKKKDNYFIKAAIQETIKDNIEDENSFKFSNILHEIIWIHRNIFKDSNGIFMKLLSKKNLVFKEAFDVSSGIEEIKKVKFKCIYVIVSGSMFSEFIQLFQKNINQIFCIPIITIFTMNIEKYQKNEYANHPFYNPGGIHVQYEELIQTFVHFDSLVKNKIEKNIISNTYNNECFNFEKIDSIPKLYFPFIYSKLIEKISDEEIYEFNKNILKYDNEQITKLIYPLTFLKQIPIEILSKFWLRIYTLETNFYSNMNCKLMKLKGKEFNTFIKLLYYSLNNKFLKSRCDICFYRGDILSNDELKIIIDKSKSESIKDKLIYSRKFLSFSSSKEVAETYLIDKYFSEGNSINYILFKILPFKGKIENAKCYNIDMKEFTKFQSEEEYLFLPYSPFILSSSEQYCIPGVEIKVNLINLSYIGNYENIIKTSMKNISTLDELSFGLLEKYFLEEIEKYKLFEKDQKIWEKIKILIKENKI